MYWKEKSSVNCRGSGTFIDWGSIGHMAEPQLAGRSGGRSRSHAAASAPRANVRMTAMQTSLSKNDDTDPPRSRKARRRREKEGLGPGRRVEGVRVRGTR